MVYTIDPHDDADDDVDIAKGDLLDRTCRYRGGSRIEVQKAVRTHWYAPMGASR